MSMMGNYNEMLKFNNKAIFNYISFTFLDSSLVIASCSILLLDIPAKLSISGLSTL